MSNNVWETKALVRMEKSEEAKKLLDRLASICAPVMARRSWRVKCLKEFYPKNAGLLGMNVNRGVSIFIRLRPDSDKNSFLPWESLLGTMVHELTHMGVGSHSAEFYKLMDEVYDEVEKDAGASGTEKKSISGAIFMTKSHRLGGGAVTQHTSLSKAACDAALRRVQSSIRSASSGQKLGGAVHNLSSLTLADRRQLAADAADRRSNDDLWCNDAAMLDNYDSDEADVGISHNAVGRVPNILLQQQFDIGPKNESTCNLLDTFPKWICEKCDNKNDLAKKECAFCTTDKNSQPPGFSLNASSISRQETGSNMGKRRHPSSMCQPINGSEYSCLESACRDCFLCSAQPNKINSIKTKRNVYFSSHANQSLNLKNGTVTSSSSSSSSSSRSGVIIIDLVDSDDDKSTLNLLGESVSSISHRKPVCYSGDDDYDDDIVIIRAKK